ncbi:hypothetical protein R6U77_10165 [Lysinibacillus louembei]|uniref:Uncharacterized protein n=1 Tax=Lysinibacillus louembei TaxID=1470088 RepID=A0ABZ0RS27_9BACI|nr:hypothetical protein [Lysinibacillus louembei]WPK10300.1 hypothetical protein R6U77_10165 [Lysinibacillus louembei]
MTNCKIVVEENGRFQFDFSALDYVWQFHDSVVKTMLSDVDFITETAQEVVFIEYKNANIKNAVNPDAMLQKIKHETFYSKIARKFYDSLLLFWACKGNEKELPITFVLIIEHPILDKKLRRQLKLKIEKQLPLQLNVPMIARQMISSFEVLSLDEWQERFPQIVVREVIPIDETPTQF